MEHVVVCFQTKYKKRSWLFICFTDMIRVEKFTFKQFALVVCVEILTSLKDCITVSETIC